MIAEIKNVAVPFDRYVAECRDVERFATLCRACPRYGATWGCPPLPTDLPRWYTAHIFAATIALPPGRHKVEDSDRLIADDKRILDRRILDLERSYGGRACSFGGYCHLCERCTRPDGLPCRHPDLLRPSLEALGFDITRTVALLPDTTLQWSTDGYLPSTLTLVSALFTPDIDIPSL